MQVPYYGKTGLNAGVMLLNMTRVKKFPGGWLDENMDMFDKYRAHMTLGSQDILNMLFYKVSTNTICSLSRPLLLISYD